MDIMLHVFISFLSFCCCWVLYQPNCLLLLFWSCSYVTGLWCSFILTTAFYCVFCTRGGGLLGWLSTLNKQKHTKFLCLGFCVMWDTRLQISRWHLCSAGQRFSQLTRSTGHVLFGFFPGRPETLLQICQGKKSCISFSSIPVHRHACMCRHNTNMHSYTHCV